MSIEKDALALGEAALIEGLQKRSWLSDALSGQAGIDGVFFQILAAPLLEEGGIYLRERDLSYFGVERRRDLVFRCLVGKGEMPCLYRVGVKADDQIYDGLPADLLPLVDLVSRTTGGGVGVALGLHPPRARPSTDLRTGRRVRYTITPLREGVHWVERAETGRPRGGFTGGAGIPTI